MGENFVNFVSFTSIHEFMDSDASETPYYVPARWISVDLPDGRSIYFELDRSGSLVMPNGENSFPVPHHIEFQDSHRCGHGSSFVCHPLFTAR